jgi:uncharacterized iron-regulated membrane protein
MSVPEHTLDDENAAAPPAVPLRRSWRPFVLRLHFYAGVLVAPFIFVAAITGALYAVAPTIERTVYGDILFVEPHGDALPLSQQAAAAQAAFPHLTISGMRPAPGPEDSTRIMFSDANLGDDTERAVFVDPYTGRVLGDEPVWFGYLPLSTWLDGLHRHLLLGEPGRVYSELAASWLWVVALGGVYLWLAKSRTERKRGRAGKLLTVDRSVSGRSRTLNWHGATGIWLLVMALFLSATGITWSTYAGAHVSDIRAALNWERPQLGTSSAHQGHGDSDPAPQHFDAASIDYNTVIDAAARAGVSAPLELTLPSDPGGGVAVTEIDKPYRLTTNAARVDPASASVTSEIDYWRDYSVVAMLADWGIRLHMGFLFGLLNQLLLLGVALALLTVIGRGYRMWWQRRPTRGSAWAVGRPPRRGGLREVHAATALVIVLAAAALGWFLPLLGISLVGFVVVDALLATVKSRRP